MTAGSQNSQETLQGNAHGSAPAQQGSSGPFLHLLYHELSAEPEAYRYALSAAAFKEHLGVLELSGKTGHTNIVPRISFDDGHVSQYNCGLPLLEKHRIVAHFFITAGWTSQRPDYMTWEQVRALAAAGQRIGAHGWSHKLLTHCSMQELKRELGDTRHLLEDRLAMAVTTMSLPGGRCNRRVLDACTAAGYMQVYTSLPRLETSRSAPLIGRLNLRSDMTAASLQGLLNSPNAIRRLERQHRLKQAVQRALGDTIYARLWALLNRAQGQAL